MANPVTIRYRAFVSYSHRDKAWGEWLHRALERTRIDKDLVGRQTPAGPVPKTLRPIFRDREDFSAGHSLTEQTLAALEASQFLIVLCSPNAAQSLYVNEEVRRFKALGRADRVIPVIVEGEPGAGERECFPPALRCKLSPEGMLTDEHEEPIAADARPQGDGKDIAKLKVVAGLLGLQLDEIVRRAEKARKRRNRIWGALAGAFLFLAVAASGSAVYAWQQLKTNEAFLSAMLLRATEIVNTAVAQAEKFYVPRSATLELLAKAEGLFDDMARLGRPTAELRYRKAWMLIEFARNYEILGDTGRQYARAAAAYDLLVVLVAENPEETSYTRALSVANNELGDVLLAQGKVTEALQAYRNGLLLVERLAKADPDNDGWQRDMSVSHNRIGNVLVVLGNLAEALRAYRTSLDITGRLANANPSVDRWQRDLAVSYDKIGNVLVTQGNLAEALQAFRTALAIVEKLAKTDPDNVTWQRDLSVCYDRIGDILFEQGNLAEALEAFRNGLAIAERLAKADPHNTIWQRDLSVSYDQVGNVLLAQNKVDEALQSYRAGLDIALRLANSDPGNTNWQRDLSVSYNKIGDILSDQENLVEALQAYRASLAIRERLAKVNPGNAIWQRDLSVSFNRVGDVLVAQGNMAEALQAFRAGLAIRERLVAADPDNATWQHDLSVSYNRVADMLIKQGLREEALAYFRQSLDIMQRLADSDPENATWQFDALLANSRLAINGDDPARRWTLIVATLRRLRDENKLTFSQSNWLSYAEERLAEQQPA